MKIIIIGADGQLGSDLSRIIPVEMQIPLTIKDIDISQKERTIDIIKKHSPDVVINTAAYHRVDDCEDNVETAFLVNSIGPRYLALACKEINAKLVHVSTDYVFDGSKKTPYLEDELPKPRSVYAISKLAGEYCVRTIYEKHFVVRSSGLYGIAGCLGKGGGNFVDNIIKQAESNPELKVVGDEVVSPTYSADLAKKIFELIKTEHYGLYHIVNHGGASWYAFANKIFQIMGKKIIINEVKASDFKLKASRPSYSVLQNGALKKIGLDDLRTWEEALADYLAQKGYLKNK
jgi:dTDP-4-dehydrorhamnose reductase